MMALQNDVIEQMLAEVSREAGSSFPKVKRVFDLIVEAHECGFYFVVTDGKIKIGSYPEILEVPSYIRQEIQACYDDVVLVFDILMDAIAPIVSYYT
jgi:hypothetical protein